jgi:hypothetical protein
MLNDKETPSYIPPLPTDLSIYSEDKTNLRPIDDFVYYDTIALFVISSQEYRLEQSPFHVMIVIKQEYFYCTVQPEVGTCSLCQ